MKPEGAAAPTLAIVGSVVDDRIRHRDGRETHSLGGLVYGVGALAAVAGKRWRLLPICRVGAGMGPRLEAVWSRAPGVDLGGLIDWSGRHTRVELDYGAPGLAHGERRERLIDPMPPLTAADVAPARGAVGVLVNLITGFDLDLAAFRALGTNRRLMLDVHSLTLARAADGSRYPRTDVESEPWLRGADVVQCNLAEAAALTGSPLDEPRTNLAERVRALLRAAGRPRLGLITLGTGGAILVDMDSDPVWLQAPRRVAGDPTGAGDTLGAAFMAGWIASVPPVDALRAAMEAAAAACELSGTRAPGPESQRGDPCG